MQNLKRNEYLCLKIGYKSTNYYIKQFEYTCSDCKHCVIIEMLEPACDSCDIGKKTVCRNGQFFHLQYKRFCNKHKSLVSVSSVCEKDFEKKD